MKKAFVVSLLALAAGVCAAQEVGRVISSTPVMQQVAVPRQVCTNEQVAVQPAKSGAGAAMGAVAGGLLGHQVGSGGGRALATLIGLVGGVMLGDKIEGSPPAQGIDRPGGGAAAGGGAAGLDLEPRPCSG